MIETNTEAPIQYSAFAQQRLPSWRPMITPNCAIIGLAIIAIFSFIVGGIFLVDSRNAVEIDKQYDDICETIGSECDVTIKIPKEIKGKIYLRYKLTDFYQAHRRFMESRNDAQLAGEYASYSDMSLCSPLRSEEDSKDPSKWILPCGLSAVSFFNDTYTITSGNYSFSEKGIAFSTDIGMYSNLSEKYTEGNKWLENYSEFPGAQTNEHFIVWMRVSSLPTVVKNYAICSDCTIPAGDFTVKIKNNYPTDLFNGHKYISIATDSLVGGKNDFLGIAYIVVGSICVILILFLIFDKIFNPRKLGDIRLIMDIVNARNDEIFMKPINQ